VRSNLSLNLGLRLERELATTERYNRSVSALISTRPVLSAPPRAPPTPGIRCRISPRRSSSSRRPAFPNLRAPQPVRKPRLLNVGPRLGVSWSPAALGGKTVIRAGTGFFSFQSPAWARASTRPDSASRPRWYPVLDGNLTPYATLGQSVSGRHSIAGWILSGPVHLPGKERRYTSYNLKTGYSYRWNFDVQRQFAHNIVVEIGYEGNHGVHLGLNRNLAVLPAQYLSRSPVRESDHHRFPDRRRDKSVHRTRSRDEFERYHDSAATTAAGFSTVYRFDGALDAARRIVLRTVPGACRKRFSYGFQGSWPIFWRPNSSSAGASEPAGCHAGKAYSSDDVPGIRAQFELGPALRQKGAPSERTGDRCSVRNHRRLDPQCDSNHAARSPLSWAT